MFALVDANSFYCSAEQVFKPEWRGKPIVVLSNNDGCIVAANRQAKEAGIPKFAPFFKVKALCQQKQVIALSSNYELYADLSAKMMQIIGRFAPEQHVYSIDESFLSFKRCHHAITSYQSQGIAIRKAVWKEARLPVCVGMGNTLTLAKVANHAAKKISGFAGVCVIDSDAKRSEILKQMAVEDVWGIGRKTTKRLNHMGINTAFELSIMAPGLARKQFNIEVERTIRELNGLECKSWQHVRSDKLQIFSTRSVGQRITDYESLLQALSKHVAIAAQKARNQGSGCKTLLLFAANSPFDATPKQFKLLINFVQPTNCTFTLTKAVYAAAHKLFDRRVQYYKIGVGLLNLRPIDQVQYDLFTSTIDRTTLMRSVDKINHRYGRDTLFLAAQGIDNKWSMRRDLLTLQYSTKWRHIPQVRC